MLPPIDSSVLSPAARRVLDPAAPAPLRAMAAKGILPGLKPGEVATVLVALAEAQDAELAAMAAQTLANLPPPLLQGALGAELEPAVVDALTKRYVSHPDVMARLLGQPKIAIETVAEVASRCNEQVAEIVATNEQRLLGHPEVLERLYMNKATRMSTADRILELAVRNGIELTGIPAYRELARAISNTLITDPTDEPTPDDLLFRETLAEGKAVALDPRVEDTHIVNDEGEEQVAEKFVPLHVRLAQMTPAQKIRVAMLGNAAERLLLMRDTNRMVSAAAIRSPAVQEPEVVRVAASRVVSEEVLRIVALNREWLRNYQVKVNLVTNPRTPFPMAAKLIPQLREHELKTIAKSKNVPAPIATAAKQQLLRKKF